MEVRYFAMLNIAQIIDALERVASVRNMVVIQMQNPTYAPTINVQTLELVSKFKEDITVESMVEIEKGVRMKGAIRLHSKAINVVSTLRELRVKLKGVIGSL